MLFDPRNNQIVRALITYPFAANRKFVLYPITLYYYMKFSMIIILALCIVSCKNKQIDVDNRAPIEIIAKSSEKIDKSVTVIEEKSRNIQQITTQPEVKEDAVKIENEANKIGEANKDIKGTVKQLETAQKTIDSLRQENQKLKEANRKLLEDAKMKTTLLLGAIVAASVLALGASVFLFVIGMPKASIGLGAASMVSASAAVTIITMWDKIAWIGLALGFLVVGILVWQISLAIRKIWQEKKAAEQERDEYSTALKETVTTVEALRAQLPEDIEVMIFGQNAIKGLAHMIQRPSTQKLVKIQKLPNV
jgi:hypothetical protein